jgi:hypothetical protein
MVSTITNYELGIRNYESGIRKCSSFRYNTVISTAGTHYQTIGQLNVQKATHSFMIAPNYGHAERVRFKKFLCDLCVSVVNKNYYQTSPEVKHA